MTTVAITGATGHIGGALAERLLQGGVNVRAVSRTLEKLAPLTAKGAQPRVGEVTDGAFLTDAFRGANAVFAMIPPDVTAPDAGAFQMRVAQSLIEAIRASKVPRIVALSSVGAGLPSGTGPIAGLHEFEELLKKEAADAAVLALRPGFFMENFLGSIPLIKASGIAGNNVRGDVIVPMIATRDIADEAAKILREPAFEGYAVRELLGPNDHTMAEATSILGAAIGKPDLKYVEFSDEDFQNGLLQAGVSGSVAASYAEMGRAMNEGRIQSTIDRAKATITSTTLEEFARDVFASAYHSAASTAG